VYKRLLNKYKNALSDLLLDKPKMIIIGYPAFQKTVRSQYNLNDFLVSECKEISAPEMQKSDENIYVLFVSTYFMQNSNVRDYISKIISNSKYEVQIFSENEGHSYSETDIKNHPVINWKKIVPAIFDGLTTTQQILNETLMTYKALKKLCSLPYNDVCKIKTILQNNNCEKTIEFKCVDGSIFLSGSVLCLKDKVSMQEQIGMIFPGHSILTLKVEIAEVKNRNSEHYTFLVDDFFSENNLNKFISSINFIENNLVIIYKEEKQLDKKLETFLQSIAGVNQIYYLKQNQQLT
jgi:hypothetical protein